MTKIYAYGIGLLLLVVAIGGAWWYVGSLRSAAATAKAKQNAAEVSLGMCASGLDATNAATEAAEARADLAKRQAQAVIDGAGKDKAANDAASANFSKKVSIASKTPDCQAVMEATLCPALSGY